MPCNWIRPSLSCSQRSCYQERYLRVRWLEIEQLDARRLLAVAGHAVAGHAVTESFDNRVSNSTNVGGKTVGTEIGTLDLAEGEVLLISTAPGPGEFLRDLNTGEIANDTSNADQLFSGGDLGIDLTGEGLAVAIFEAGEGRILDTHQEFSDGNGGTRISLGDPGGGSNGPFYSSCWCYCGYGNRPVGARGRERNRHSQLHVIVGFSRNTVPKQPVRCVKSLL